MDTIFFLVLRRMRTPLISLIVVYAVAMAGMALIPGQDADGNPARMSVFHAFYFVSYMSTTIGFGELPYPFTDLQRLWVSFAVFFTVAVWIYAIGALIALLQDPVLQRAIAERGFRRRVRRLQQPFYLVCGYGQTGGALVGALTERHLRPVVIDIDPDRINLLGVENHREFVPALCADARSPDTLKGAGLGHPCCQGVVALTNVNETNLKIAITAKLLCPEIPVICRSDSHEIEANMRSFNTDHVYDPFDTFALSIAVAIQAPCLTELGEWLAGGRQRPPAEPRFPPNAGRWVICGYGRFGKAMYKHLKAQGLEVTVIEAAPHLTGVPAEGVVHGRGTEAATLEQAEIQRAVGLVAGTDQDADNLSIVMTALELNDDLFVIARENHLQNQELFDRVGAQVIMHPSLVVANRIRLRLVTPLLADFNNLANFQDEPWACALLSRVLGVADDDVLLVWELTIDETDAGAIYDADGRGLAIRLDTLLRDPRDRERQVPAIALLLVQDGVKYLLPAADERIHAGDRLLFCGSEASRARMAWVTRNIHALGYVLNGESPRDGPLWRWIRAWQARH